MGRHSTGQLGCHLKDAGNCYIATSLRSQIDRDSGFMELALTDEGSDLEAPIA